MIQIELIDRLKTIKALDEAKIRTTSEEYDRILDVIGSMPTIEERKKERWKQSDEDDDYVECPFCGHLTNCECKEDVWRLHYCFHCGAEMEGTEDETEKE